MNTGIIMIGLSLVLLSVGLISSPASAAHPHGDCGSSILLPDLPHGTNGITEPAGTIDLPIPGAETKTYGSGYLPDHEMARIIHATHQNEC